MVVKVAKAFCDEDLNDYGNRFILKTLKDYWFSIAMRDRNLELVI